MPLYTVDPQQLAAMREKMQASQAHKLRKLGESIRIQLERSDVGAPQAVVLLALCSQGDMEPAQIADHVMIPRQTITSILDKLAALGLVVRTDHPSDRRRKIVCLTQAGFDVAALEGQSAYDERSPAKVGAVGVKHYDAGVAIRREIASLRLKNS